MKNIFALAVSVLFLVFYSKSHAASTTACKPLDGQTEVVLAVAPNEVHELCSKSEFENVTYATGTSPWRVQALKTEDIPGALKANGVQTYIRISLLNEKNLSSANLILYFKNNTRTEVWLRPVRPADDTASSRQKMLK